MLEHDTKRCSAGRRLETNPWHNPLLLGRHVRLLVALVLLSHTTGSTAQGATLPMSPLLSDDLSSSSSASEATAAAATTATAVDAADRLRAATADFGAYIGCFNVSSSGWVTGSETSTKVAAYDSVTIANCSATCADAFYSLATITLDWHCRCTMQLPSEADRWPDSNCTAWAGGAGAFGTPAAVYYLHAASNTMRCRMSHPDFTSDNWSIAYSPENVAFERNSTANSTQVSVRLKGTTGSRLRTTDGDHLYGAWQVEAQVAAAPGAVTALYLRSGDTYPNDKAGNFSEIDVEWLNANPAKEPGSLWLNAFTNSNSTGELLIAPPVYQALLGWPTNRTAANSFATYTINWQPDCVTWAVDGKNMRTMRNGELRRWFDMGGVEQSAVFSSPNLPSRITISMWTDTSRGKAPADMFGGRLDAKKGPYYSYFRQMRRVLCDQPLPAGMQSPGGPAWLTAAVQGA